MSKIIKFPINPPQKKDVVKAEEQLTFDKIKCDCGNTAFEIFIYSGDFEEPDQFNHEFVCTRCEAKFIIRIELFFEGEEG